MSENTVLTPHDLDNICGWKFNNRTIYWSFIKSYCRFIIFKVLTIWNIIMVKHWAIFCFAIFTFIYTSKWYIIIYYVHHVHHLHA